MRRYFLIIATTLALSVIFQACKNDSSNAGGAVLDDDDAIIVLADTFGVSSAIEAYESIVSQTDSFLLGEMETDYGLLHASILTQLACPEGYHYPDNAEIDSVCLFMNYASWVGDGYSPLAVNAYLMDRGTFNYSRAYETNLDISDYCSRSQSVLTNKRIVVASEKLDSIATSSGTYIPMLRMKLNDDFAAYFGGIRSFESQEDFNRLFKGLLIETSFGSSTVLNISDIALGVYYHFSYPKAGKDTTVNDMKAFYANSEVRTINHIAYSDHSEWISQMRADSLAYNYIVSPACVYTRIEFPMQEMADTIMKNLMTDSLEMDGEQVYIYKRAYVNLARVRVEVDNVYTGTEAEKTRNDWLQPAGYMLLVKENSIDRFFANRELPSDTCALLSTLTQGTDSAGNATYYYSFDMSSLLTKQLREESPESKLTMLLVPVSVSTATSTSSGSTSISAVKEQQTISATKVRSAQNGLNLKLVYSGF